MLISNAIGAMLDFESQMKQVNVEEESIAADLVTPSSSQVSRPLRPEESREALERTQSESQEGPIFSLAAEVEGAQQPGTRGPREVCVEDTDSVRNGASLEVSPNTTQAQNYLPLSTGAKKTANHNVVLCSNFTTSIQQSPDTDLRREIKYSEQERIL